MAVLIAGLALVAVPGSASAHDCTCRYAGVSFKQGEVACVRDKLVRCAMYLNNSSWTFVADSCPQVRLPQHSLPQHSPPQHAAAEAAETVSR